MPHAGLHVAIECEWRQGPGLRSEACGQARGAREAGVTAGRGSVLVYRMQVACVFQAKLVHVASSQLGRDPLLAQVEAPVTFDE